MSRFSETTMEVVWNILLLWLWASHKLSSDDHVTVGGLTWKLVKLQKKLMGQSKEIKQNRTRAKNWDLVLRNFWVLWAKFCFWKEDLVLGSVSTHFLESYEATHLKSLYYKWSPALLVVNQSYIKMRNCFIILFLQLSGNFAFAFYL